MINRDGIGKIAIECGSLGSTPLHVAASHNAADKLAASRQILSLLVEHGADPNAKGFRHWTPLTLAVINGNIDNVALLLAAGASPNPKNVSGYYPCEHGAQMTPKKRRIITMLLRAGAPPPRASHAGTWMSGKCPATGRPKSGGAYYNNAQARAMRQYVAKIAAAGSWAAYEKAHTTRLVTVFEKVFPRPRLPHEIASHVVRFWFHTGDY